MELKETLTGTRRGLGKALLATVATLATFGVGFAGTAGAQTLDELIAAAQAEGEVNWYTGATENVAIEVG